VGVQSDIRHEHYRTDLDISNIRVKKTKSDMSDIGLNLLPISDITEYREETTDKTKKVRQNRTAKKGEPQQDSQRGQPEHDRTILPHVPPSIHPFIHCFIHTSIHRPIRTFVYPTIRLGSTKLNKFIADISAAR
jgi:hypothetical protein